MASEEQYQKIVDGSFAKLSIHGRVLSISISAVLFGVLDQSEVDTTLLFRLPDFARFSASELFVQHLANVTVHFVFVVLVEKGSQRMINMKGIH